MFTEVTMSMLLMAFNFPLPNILQLIIYCT